MFPVLKSTQIASPAMSSGLQNGKIGLFEMESAAET